MPFNYIYSRWKPSAILDRNINYPECKCDSKCKFPCWQRVGIADTCESCGCPSFDAKKVIRKAKENLQIKKS